MFVAAVGPCADALYVYVPTVTVTVGVATLIVSVVLVRAVLVHPAVVFLACA